VIPFSLALFRCVICRLTPFTSPVGLVTYACGNGVQRCIAARVNCGERWSRSPPQGTGLDVSLHTILEPNDSKEILMNSRAFFLVTSLAVLWFCIFTTGAEALQQAVGNTKSPQVDIPSLQQQADRGDAKAKYQLGWSYMTGTGVTQNFAEAAKYYRQAAAQSSPDAEFALGYLYEQGKGVLRDYRHAVVYYTAAAGQGHLTAENNLGSMYEYGRGVHKNLRQAEHWYQMAAERGDVTAQCNLASLYFRGGRIPRKYAQAAEWFRKAAERGYAPAQEDLAWMYFTGTGVPLDDSSAAHWVQMAADRGYERAQLDLAYLYEQGKGVPLNYVTAYTWYKTAASGGEERAIGRLKSLSAVMTKEQIGQANVAAEQLSRSLPKVDGAADSKSIGSSFIRHAAEDLHRQEERIARANPATVIRRESTCRNGAVNVGMQK